MIVVSCQIYSFVVKSCYAYLDLEVMFFSNYTLQTFTVCLLFMCILMCIYIYVCLSYNLVWFRLRNLQWNLSECAYCGAWNLDSGHFFCLNRVSLTGQSCCPWFKSSYTDGPNSIGFLLYTIRVKVEIELISKI